MARHRSPSGAETDDLESTTTHLRAVATPGVHRLPPPPAASLCGRATVAAVAAGAVIAAGQTLVTPLLGHGPDKISALLPVASISGTGPGTAAGAHEIPAGIGGDQPLPEGLTAVDTLDAGSALDVKNLMKAVDIGQELAKQATLIHDALAEGAAEARAFGDFIFVRPTTGVLTSAFGMRWGAQHAGIDIANKIGTPIYALTDGVVEESGPASGFGLWVVLRHDDGTRSVYGHINRSFVKVGQKIRAGEEIAEIGNRGESTGPHLHLEIWDQNGNRLNPVTWLAKRGIRI